MLRPQRRLAASVRGGVALLTEFLVLKGHEALTIPGPRQNNLSNQRLSDGDTSGARPTRTGASVFYPGIQYAIVLD